MDVFVKEPQECSALEISQFADLVRKSGEVNVDNLEARIHLAAFLAFLHLNGQTLGIAALKRPMATYRAHVAFSAGVDLNERRFPFELGWIYLEPSLRGHGRSRQLGEILIRRAGCGIFATSRAANDPSVRLLAALGFEEFGSAYPSARGPYDLRLFILGPSHRK